MAKTRKDNKIGIVLLIVIVLLFLFNTSTNDADVKKPLAVTGTPISYQSFNNGIIRSVLVTSQPLGNLNNLYPFTIVADKVVYTKGKDKVVNIQESQNIDISCDDLFYDFYILNDEDVIIGNIIGGPPGKTAPMTTNTQITLNLDDFKVGGYTARLQWVCNGPVGPRSETKFKVVDGGGDGGGGGGNNNMLQILAIGLIIFGVVVMTRKK